MTNHTSTEMQPRSDYLLAYWESYYRALHGIASFAPPGERVGEIIHFESQRTQGWRDGAWAARLDGLMKLPKDW